MTLQGKRAGFLLFGGLLILYAVICVAMSAFVPYDECTSDVPSGEGVWKHEADGTCWYLHSIDEFDNSRGCDACHGVEPDVVYDFKPDLRIRLSDGKLVSVLEVNGNDCTLWGGEIVPCDTVVKPKPFPPAPEPMYGMR